jgi:hypothetical protein
VARPALVPVLGRRVLQVPGLPLEREQWVREVPEQVPVRVQQEPVLPVRELA